MNLKDLSARSVCPVACALEIIGDRWTLLVIRDLMAGASHYSDFENAPEGISTNILADRLSKLASWGLIAKRDAAPYSRRKIYELTDLGESLRPVMRSIALWGLENIQGTEQRIKA